MSFTTFGLFDPLVQGILATGYTAPTEIQSRAIPAAVSGRDIIGCAQTGTGKTAAFALPILERMNTKHDGSPRALIVAPSGLRRSWAAAWMKFTRVCSACRRWVMSCTINTHPSSSCGFSTVRWE